MDSQSSAGVGQLVGREQELEHIEGVLDGLADGTPACIAIEGEAGIGKTRLLTELRARAEERGAVVLQGAAAEFEREMPFSVWVDALDAYVASQRLELHDAWDDELASELAQVLPSLAGAGSRAAIADERYKAHRAVRTLLAVIADDQPLVLLLDDLHWSDAASAEMIAALVARDPGAPVLIVLAYRPRQLPERLSAAVAGKGVQRLCLEELTEAEACELLAGTGSATVAAIYRHGGGNPFYLEQLGRTSNGLAMQPDAQNGGGGPGVPPAVAAAIAAELASLLPQSRAFLDGAAVAGEPFEPGLAAAAADLPEAAGLDALDDLLALDLVRPTEVPRRFTFRHPLVRRAVYDSTRGGWKLAAHARVAEKLAAQGASASECAHHVEQSASQGDDHAIEVLLEAGRAAASRAPATSVRWFDAALRLLPASDTERRVALLVELASVLRAVGELERCASTLLDASSLLPPGADARRVELTAECAAVEHWLGRHDDAHRRLIRAWSDLPDPETAEGAALQIELAVDGMYAGDQDQTLTMGRGALATACALGDPGLIAAAASVLALGEVSSGDVASGRTHRDQAVEQIEQMTDAELAVRLETVYFLAWSETYLELYDEAVQRAERATELARATGQGRLLVPLMLMRGFPFEMLGRLDDAIEICQAAVEISRLSANPHYLFWSLFELGWANYFAGHLDDAITVSEESLRVGGRMLGGTIPSGGGGPGWVLAVSHFESGDVSRAASLMEELGSDDMGQWIPLERFFNWENVAHIEVAQDRIDLADAIATRAEAAAAQIELRLPTVLATRTRAAVLMAQGDHAGAAEVAATSIAAAEQIGAGAHTAYSRSLRGHALAAAGDRAQAIEVLREAERELDTCGSVRMRDAARRELRKLGARAEKRGPASSEESGYAALTKREREIADLVTDRLTNRQIAETLFLSAKTVESHIRNLFMKLGASSRVEVARIVERERREST